MSGDNRWLNFYHGSIVGQLNNCRINSDDAELLITEDNYPAFSSNIFLISFSHHNFRLIIDYYPISPIFFNFLLTFFINEHKLS